MRASWCWRLALAATLAWACALPAAADPPMWRVKGPNAEVVLFGSVHVLREGPAWRSPALDAVIASADTVWFETPADAAAQARGAAVAARRGRLPSGRKLSQYLPPEGRALLVRTAARVGLPMAQLEPLRPWFAEVLISMADLQQKGARQGLGVEEQLSARIPSTARREAFETPDQQIAILADQPMSEQVATLLQTLREIEDEPDNFVRLQRAWQDGDVAWIEREALAPMKTETPRLYRRLVVARNRAWTARIERLLKGSEQALIVVGVGHLVGPDGVPAMLRKKGLTVEGP